MLEVPCPRCGSLVSIRDFISAVDAHAKPWRVCLPCATQIMAARWLTQYDKAGLLVLPETPGSKVTTVTDELLDTPK